MGNWLQRNQQVSATSNSVARIWWSLIATTHGKKLWNLEEVLAVPLQSKWKLVNHDQNAKFRNSEESKFIQFLSYCVKCSFTWLYREKLATAFLFTAEKLIIQKHFALRATMKWKIEGHKLNIFLNCGFLSFREKKKLACACDFPHVTSILSIFSLKLCAVTQLLLKFEFCAFEKWRKNEFARRLDGKYVIRASGKYIIRAWSAFDEA